MRVIDFHKVAIAITTHNRPEYAQLCTQQWAATTDYRQMFLLVNHPDGAKGVTLPPHCEVIHVGRIPEHGGCMAQTWNTAFHWAFRDPEIEWLICSMDDAVITPGWPPLLDRYEADLYQAPAGDLVFMLNWEAFRKIGWFDERFRLIGFQEWDFMARAVRALGLDRVSLEDAHGWCHNPIGLSTHWIHRGGGAAATTRRGDLMGHAQEWLQQKWGMTHYDFVGMMNGGNIKEPQVPEIDWYPWFGR